MTQSFYRIVLLMMIFFNSEFLPQTENAITDSLKLKLKNFEYSEVIKSANAYLNSLSQLSPTVITEIYLLKGISNYSLGNEIEAKADFMNILKIKFDFKPSPILTSPKIISFFENVRNEYSYFIQESELPNETKRDSLKILSLENSSLLQNLSKSKATLKSILLPGWGQRQMNSDLKGWVFTSAAIISLGASIFYVIDTNKKEREYLNEVENSKIKSSYNSYNSAYRIRNFSIALFVATWSFNLIDLLFLSD